MSIALLVFCELLGNDMSYFLIQEAFLVVTLSTSYAVTSSVRNKYAKKRKISVMQKLRSLKRRFSSTTSVEESFKSIKKTAAVSSVKTYGPILLFLFVVTLYGVYILPVYFSSTSDMRIIMCTIVHPLLAQICEATVRASDRSAWTDPNRVAQKSLRTCFLKQFLALTRRVMLMNVGSYQKTLLVIVASSIEEAFMRGFLVQIDTRVRKLLGHPPLKGDALSIQKIVWMCDTCLTSTCEISAIVSSSMAFIILEKNKTAFALGYTVSGSVVIAQIFVQLLVELGAETLIDIAATYCELEHDVPVTDFF